MFSFSKKASVDDDSPEPKTAQSEADIVINGSMRGNVEGQCDVLIDVKGHCVGCFRVKDLAIHGTMIGDVYADELVIYPTGQLYYRNVFAQNTIVHEGGVYSGNRDALGEGITEKVDAAVSSTETVKADPLPVLELNKDTRRKSKGPTFINTY